MTSPPALHWQLIEREELAKRLARASALHTRDIDGATLYQFTCDQHSQLVLTLPGGRCLLIHTPARSAPAERRRENSDSKPEWLHPDTTKTAASR